MFRNVLLPLCLAAALSAAAQEPPAPAVLRLDDVLQEVHAHNPGIAASQHAIEAQRHRITPAGALPEPTIAVSWMGSAVPFDTMAGDPSSYRGLTAMQTLPLGGKRELRREIARKEVSASEADQLIVVRRLEGDTKAAYYDYFYTGKALEITARNKLRLQQLSEISEARYRVGKATQQDVLRAQLEISLLLQRTVTLDQQRDTAAARLNSLMGRRLSSPLPPAEELQRTSLPELDSLVALAHTNDPALQMHERQIERSRLDATLAHKEYIPDLSVGYMFQQRTGQQDMNGMVFQVNLPIFYKSRQREAEAAAGEEIVASENALRAHHLQLAYELAQWYAMATSAGKMLDLYDKAILPQSELALESAQSSYTVGSVDFLTVISSLTAINGYQLDYYRQLADYQTAIARIEALTGDLSANTGTEVKQ